MTAPRGTIAVAVAVAVAVAAATAALAVGAALRGPIPMPVVALLGGPPVRLATLRFDLAVLVPPALVAAVAVVRATGRLRGTAVPWALMAAAPVELVLVARADGVVDAAALVLVYATAAGGVLLRALARPGGGPMPFRWSAVLGIVPWGVVAFTQVGGLLAGTPPATGVRVLVLAVLAATVAEWMVGYRRRDDPPDAAVGLLLVAVPALLLGVLGLALVR